jgi:hypothetical protein
MGVSVMPHKAVATQYEQWHVELKFVFGVETFFFEVIAN